jgi:hypothetical protein
MITQLCNTTVVNYGDGITINDICKTVGYCDGCYLFFCLMFFNAA